MMQDLTVLDIKFEEGMASYLNVILLCTRVIHAISSFDSQANPNFLPSTIKGIKLYINKLILNYISNEL